MMDKLKIIERFVGSLFDEAPSDLLRELQESTAKAAASFSAETALRYHEAFDRALASIRISAADGHSQWSAAEDDAIWGAPDGENQFVREGHSIMLNVGRRLRDECQLHVTADGSWYHRNRITVQWAPELLACAKKQEDM